MMTYRLEDGLEDEPVGPLEDLILRDLLLSPPEQVAVEGPMEQTHESINPYALSQRQSIFRDIT